HPGHAPPVFQQHVGPHPVLGALQLALVPRRAVRPAFRDVVPPRLRRGLPPSQGRLAHHLRHHPSGNSSSPAFGPVLSPARRETISANIARPSGVLRSWPSAFMSSRIRAIWARALSPSSRERLRASAIRLLALSHASATALMMLWFSFISAPSPRP